MDGLRTITRGTGLAFYILSWKVVVLLDSRSEARDVPTSEATEEAKSSAEGRSTGLKTTGVTSARRGTRPVVPNPLARKRTLTRHCEKKLNFFDIF